MGTEILLITKIQISFFHQSNIPRFREGVASYKIPVCDGPLGTKRANSLALSVSLCQHKKGMKACNLKESGAD